MLTLLKSSRRGQPSGRPLLRLNIIYYHKYRREFEKIRSAGTAQIGLYFLRVVQSSEFRFLRRVEINQLLYQFRDCVMAGSGLNLAGRRSLIFDFEPELDAEVTKFVNNHRSSIHNLRITIAVPDASPLALPAHASPRAPAPTPLPSQAPEPARTIQNLAPNTSPTISVHAENIAVPAAPVKASNEGEVRGSGPATTSPNPPQTTPSPSHSPAIPSSAVPQFSGSIHRRSRSLFPSTSSEQRPSPSETSYLPPADSTPPPTLTPPRETPSPSATYNDSTRSEGPSSSSSDEEEEEVPLVSSRSPTVSRTTSLTGDRSHYSISLSSSSSSLHYVLPEVCLPLPLYASPSFLPYLLLPSPHSSSFSIPFSPNSSHLFIPELYE